MNGLRKNHSYAMFERKQKLQIEDLLQRQFCTIQTKKKELRSGNCSDVKPKSSSPNEQQNMTRKTRTRRPRVHSIQSGYCAVCHIPYNSVEDHIQSKRHQKLIGEDANYISLNGSFNDHQDGNSIDSFLNLNGLEGIGVNGTERDFAPKLRPRTMPRTRTASVLCERVKPSAMSPTGSDTAGHHLRSRRNINYMTPPLEEDSLSEKPDLEPVQEYRELRSSTRLLAKLTVDQDEVWNSGRPKRACIRQKRISADERLVSDNKSYYKVEVMSTKLRSAGSQYHIKEQRMLSKQEEEDKALIVKFKKLRNSELVQLNNEATNFLFPKKDDGDTTDEDDDNERRSNMKNHSNLLSSDGEQTPVKFKVEDEASMDSSCSEGKRRKKRRTHAEAFIMDNQKYYKFETPGSRLRYHGTFLAPPNQSRNNGEAFKDEPSKTKREKRSSLGLNLDNYNFSFESIPKNTSWYQTFQRQDRGEMRYNVVSDNCYWEPFLLPYQIGPLPPIDPKQCINKYNQIMKLLREPTSSTPSAGSSTPDPSASNSSSSMDVPEVNDEDSKTSENLEEVSKVVERKKRGRKVKALVPPSVPASSGGKNPRKSPRQHASTLAILSSLIQQRKRRSGSALNHRQNLPTILEEKSLRSPGKGPKVDYCSKAKELEDQLNFAFADNLDMELEIATDDPIDFRESKVTVCDILTLYEEGVKREASRNPKRFFNGTPGRKPGRRKKKNKTGWPNKNRRFPRKEPSSTRDDESTVDDTMSVNLESEEEPEEETSMTEDSISNPTQDSSFSEPTPGTIDSSSSEVVRDCDLNCFSDNRVEHTVLTNKVNNSGVDCMMFQPYVCVQKLDSDKLTKSRRSVSPKRTSRRQRRMPGSPKSPRMLRKPRGRWYRER